jgi:hypothetical protein
MEISLEYESWPTLTTALAKYLETDTDQPPPLKANTTSREISKRIGDEVPDFPTGTYQQNMAEG